MGVAYSHFPSVHNGTDTIGNDTVVCIVSTADDVSCASCGYSHAAVSKERVLVTMCYKLRASKVYPDPLKCEVIPKVYVKRLEIDDGTSVIVDIEEDNDDDFSFEVKEADIARFEKIIEKYN